jgi:hypothetical protein
VRDSRTVRYRRATPVGSGAGRKTGAAAGELRRTWTVGDDYDLPNGAGASLYIDGVSNPLDVVAEKKRRVGGGGICHRI